MEKWEKQINSEDILERVTADRFIKTLKNAPFIEHFDTDLYLKLVEKITVHDETKLTISFLDGSNVECEIK